MQASRIARPGVIVAAGVLALVIHAFPGVMTEESFEYLRQARSRFYAPENPPALSGLWRWLEVLVAGPTAMLLVQVTAFALGAYMILSRALSPVRAASVTAALLVAPPLLVPLSTIWSHSMMTGLVTLGIAMLLSERVRVHRAALLVLFVATCAQPSAAIATLPPIVAWFRWRVGDAGMRRILLAAGAWLAISLAALGASKHYTKAPTAVWSYVIPREAPRFDVPARVLPDEALKLGVQTRTTAIQDCWTDVHLWLDAHTPLFTPWPYLALLALLIPFALRQREQDVLVLLASALAFHAPAIVTGWLVAATLLAAALVIARRRA